MHDKGFSRRAILGRALAVAALAGIGPQLARAAAVDRTVVVLGDSLSAGYGLDTGQGWVALLALRLRRQAPGWTVFNASVSGDTTAGGRARLPAVLARRRPSVVVVELGGNDALRGLSLDATRANLLAMVREIRAAGARPLLVGMQIPPNYGPVYTRQFADLFPEVARQTHSPLVPFLLAGVVQHPDWFQADNIHPNARAQPTMLDNVWRVLGPMIEAAKAPAAKPAR